MVGKPIDAAAAEVLREHGHDPEGHRARQVSGAILGTAELILVMERAHQAEIARAFPEVSGKTFLLGHWDRIEVPDPYRQHRAAFDHVHGLIERSVARWSAHI